VPHEEEKVFRRRLVSIHTISRGASLGVASFRKAAPMTTRVTLRLGGLVAAIAVSLAIVSSASARPVGLYAQSKTEGSWIQHKGGTGVAPVSVAVKAAHLSGSWLQHNGGTSVSAATPTAPANGLSRTGAPRIPVTVVEQVERSGFGWRDAAIGAVVGLGLALIAGYAAMTLRRRRGSIILGA
jgi:hypothetical protein